MRQCAIINAVNYASAINWGSVPDWFAAIGTIVSVLLIGAGLLREIRRRRLDDEQTAAERREIEAERRDAEAAQARLVTSSLGANPRGRFAEISVDNASDAPILGVTPTIVIRPVDGTPERRTPVRMPNSQIAPHSEAPVGVRLDDAGDLIADDLSNIDLEVEYTDVHGRRWRRLGDEQPERVLDQG